MILGAWWWRSIGSRSTLRSYEGRVPGGPRSSIPNSRQISSNSSGLGITGSVGSTGSVAGSPTVATKRSKPAGAQATSQPPLGPIESERGSAAPLEGAPREVAGEGEARLLDAGRRDDPAEPAVAGEPLEPEQPAGLL